MLISSDSHVVEPGDLWTTRLPDEFRDTCLRAVQDPNNHHWYMTGPNLPRGVDLTLSVTAGITPAEVDAALAEDPNAHVGARGGSDPVARLHDIWVDGTAADVLYPTAGLSVLQLEDQALQEASCRAYNDWWSEFVSVDPARLVGLAMIATVDMKRAVEELTRARERGLRGAIMWTSPPEGDSFFDPRYEPLWAAAEDLQMPISLHILAGRRASTGLSAWNTDVEHTFFFTFENRLELQRSVCELIAAEVFERHPGLRVVAAEGGIEYAATLERRLDSGFKSFWGKRTKLSMLPSEYFRRNVYCTFITDPVGLNNIRFTGADHFMWSSDYPHGAASWPRSQETIDEEAGAAGLDAATIRKLTCTNAAELYGIDLNVVASPSPVLGDTVSAN